MCKSLAEGGARCASHTRPGFEQALAGLDGSERARVAGEDAVVAYASTESGLRDVLAAARDAREQDRPEDAEWLAGCAGAGEQHRRASVDVEAAVRAAREFGDEAGLGGLAARLREMSPTEVDGEAAALYYQQMQELVTLQRAEDRVFYEAGARRRGSRLNTWDMTLPDAVTRVEALAVPDVERPWQGRDARRALAGLAEARMRVAAARRRMAVYAGEYQTRVGAWPGDPTRKGWPRAFLAVTNGEGHVHRDMQCPSCNKGAEATQFAWMTEYSGLSEEQIVAAAGVRACSQPHCYESAPVDTWDRPTQMFSEEERRRAREREEREAARVAKKAAAAAKAPTKSGEPLEVQVSFMGRPRRETFKTEVAATRWYVQEKKWNRRSNDEDQAAYEAAFTLVEAALAEKHGKPVETVRAELARKVEASRRRDERG